MKLLIVSLIACISFSSLAALRIQVPIRVQPGDVSFKAFDGLDDVTNLVSWSATRGIYHRGNGYFRIEPDRSGFNYSFVVTASYNKGGQTEMESETVYVDSTPSVIRIRGPWSVRAASIGRYDAEACFGGFSACFDVTRMGRWYVWGEGRMDSFGTYYAPSRSRISENIEFTYGGRRETLRVQIY